MASFADLPLDIIKEIIDNFQDDLAALGACSQTCLSLLPLCRKHIFRTITLTPRSLAAQFQGFPRYITLFGSLLDSNSGIAGYVQNLVYQIQPPDFADDSVPRMLEKLHRVQSFRLIGENVNWNALRPPLRESLLHIIHLRSVTRLEISYLVLPINTFIPCINLTDLTLIHIESAIMDIHEREYFAPDIVPRLQSFTFGVWVGEYTKSLVNARRSNDLPVLDFSNLRTLIVNVGEYSDLGAVHALMKITEKLETLYYIVDHLIDGYTGLVSMNPSSFSTLRRLHFECTINDDIQDPLCGIGAEITVFSGHNVIEEINLEINVQTDCQCKTDDHWGRLDVVLATGFARLSQVSLHITIFVCTSNGIVLQEKLNKLPEEQFPWLSQNSIVKFKFLTKIIVV